MNPINNFMGSGTYEGAFIGAEREGNKDKWMVASSPYYASDDDPPVIMFHGTSDNIVNIEQSQELYDSLKNHNVVTEFVKVSGGSHGDNKMYADENLNKAVAFLDKAREAKAAAAVVTPPDTSAQDTAKTDTVPPGIVYDTLPDALPVLRSLDAVPVTYDIFALDGTLVSRSSVLNKQALRPGVYYVVSKYNTGERKMFRIVKR